MQGVRWLLGAVALLALAGVAVASPSPRDVLRGEVGLVLVPVAGQRAARPQEAEVIPDSPDSAESARRKRAVRDGHKKYQRLAHSVHVQSDIRYRSVCSSAEAALPCTVSPKVTLVSLLLCCWAFPLIQ